MTDNLIPKAPVPKSDLDDIRLTFNSSTGVQQMAIVEELYTEHNENLLKYWLSLAREKTKAHNIKGKIFKRRHEVVGLPATLLPLIFTPISGVMANVDGIQYANVAVLALTGILSGIHNFWDLARRSQKHFEYEAKYADVVTTIMVELSKERSIRIRADRFIEMMQSKIDGLGANEPLL